MKVSPKDLDNLIFTLAPIDTVELRDKFRAAVVSGQIKVISDADKSYRWGVYHMVYDAGFSFAGDYMDAHIDTALRRAVVPLSEL